MRGAISVSCVVAGRAVLSMVQSSTLPCLQFRCMTSRKLDRGCSHPINRNSSATKGPLQAIAHPELRPSELSRANLSGASECAAIGFGAAGPDTTCGTVKTEQSTGTTVSSVRYAPIYVTVGERSKYRCADRCPRFSLTNGDAEAHSETSGIVMTVQSVQSNYSGDTSHVENQRSRTVYGQAPSLTPKAVSASAWFE